MTVYRITLTATTSSSTADTSSTSVTTRQLTTIYPDGQRYDQLPEFAEQGGLPSAPFWGASACVEHCSAAIDDNNFNEHFYNNTCLMQSTGNVLAWDRDSCDVTTPSWQPVMPHLANNTYYTTSSAPFTMACRVNGTSKPLDFAGWQKAGAGHDAGSVQKLMVSTSDMLSQLLRQAAEMLGMTGQLPSRASVSVD